ncbi:MAG: sugar ABC transporter ATP-binding protein [Chloroflexi bacterium RBG_16_64_43]|nr:MAG: sugar ABC transporter ATP-binding protein [Chloroflexi bacterium RBG_16_64_43]
MPVIRTEQLTKIFRVVRKEPGLRGSLKALVRPRFENIAAVNQVSFEIDAGEIVGYIGVNGAGKSTTIKMLTGILVPTSGSVQVLGRDPHRQRVANAREIGAVFGQRTQLWWDLPFIESLALVGRIYEVPPARYRQLLKDFEDTLGLSELLHIPIRNMSLGQKMRAELAATLIHEPRVVYLDEPTIGLDLLAKERIRDFIREQNRGRGTTVLLTTHDLGDIEQLCPRVIIIDAGRLIYDGPIATIKERFGRHREITFETSEATTAIELPRDCTRLAAEPHRLTLRFDRTRTTASQIAAAVMEQIEVLDFSLAEPDLASIVRQIYQGGLREVEGNPRS